MVQNNVKSLSEQINDICKSSMKRRDKVTALMKLGIRENEIQFIMPSFSSPAPRSDAFKYTFGVEIETAGCDVNLFTALATAKGLSVYNHLHAYHGCHTDIPQFKLVPDSSISGANPAECVTPALDGTPEGFKSLKTCCDSLNASGARANRSCGLHVHIGASELSDGHYINVFKNYQALEAVIDTIVAPSRRHCQWCRSIRSYDFSTCRTKADVSTKMYGDRYHKVNPVAYSAHGTIEFRQHQGSTNFTKIKAWVTFCAKLVAYSAENVLDREISSIDEIPFLTAREKAYFNRRKAALESGREREAA